ncbi:MAG: S24/S26 family peptidase [Kiritimatiellae bacterium]|jgi:hypothetical protein|nr:S24/S26 family peptidase [Kiritimatiellia bacterium]MDY0149090.1 S24/S26 family peptidase [Kiritimatiellia bacterium]
MKTDQDLFTGVLQDALQRGDSVWLRVQGASMRPWLCEGERIRIHPAKGRPIHRGDIVLFWRNPGHPILHRVLRVGRAAEGTIYECRGDAERGRPERVPAARVIGLAAMTGWGRMGYRLLQPVRRALNQLVSTRTWRPHHG